MERHLAGCPACAQARAETLTVKEMASAWGVDAPDISPRVMQAAAADDQHALLDEMRRLRAEMAELRAEVASLRRRISPRPEILWTLPSHLDSPQDYPRMENDPWNLVRS